MSVLKEFKGAIAFLTIFPTGEKSLSSAIDGMHYFPIVGAFIGFLTGIFNWLITRFLSSLLASTFTIGFLLLITGLHHLDGLADFGDGIMASGSKEDRWKAMHDVNIGVGGLTLTIIIILSLIFAISQLALNILIQSLIISEVSAKLSMVFLALISKPAYEGMGASFIKGMKGKRGVIKFFISLVFSLAIALFLLSFPGFLMLIIGLLTAIVMLIISKKKFGGVTGDVFGAVNEVSRMASLITVYWVISWI